MLPRLLAPYLAQLEALPFVRSARAAEATRPSTNATLTLETPTRAFVLPVQLERTTLTGELAQRRIHQRATLPGLLILAPVIGPVVGAALAEANVFFMDLAGNCYLDLAGRYVAHKQGQRSAARPVENRGLRAPALQVLFSLLAAPELTTATTRVVAVAAGGVSPQTVSDTRARLSTDGVLARTRQGCHFRPGGWRKGLDLYLYGFRQTLPALTVGRYRAHSKSPDAARADLRKVLADVAGWRWGGAAAALLLEGHYRGEKTLLYGEDWDARALPVVADATGPIELRRPPCPAAMRGPRTDCVHPLLVYADLLAEGNDRAGEGAAEIFERYLEPLAASAA